VPDGYRMRSGQSGAIGLMDTLCCQLCRLRFSRDAAAYLTACPECGAPATRLPNARNLLGFRLFDPQDIADVIRDPIQPLQPEPRGRRH
jgi:hypothetical protein